MQEMARQSDFEAEVIALVNQERWDNGQLPPLKGNGLLADASESHSQNMATRNFFAHCDVDTGTRPQDRVTAAGYAWNAVGENIAAGYGTPEVVMDAWMNSSGHRANILSSTFRETGVGYVYDGSDVGNVRLDQNGDCTADVFNQGPYRSYWTQNFGRTSGDTAYPVIINREALETTDIHVALYLYGAGFATEMRIRNAGGEWTSWQPFMTEVSWVLSFGDGLKEVFVEIRNTARIGNPRAVYSASDTITLAGTSLCDMPADFVFWPVADIRFYIPCLDGG